MLIVVCSIAVTSLGFDGLASGPTRSSRGASMWTVCEQGQPFSVYHGRIARMATNSALFPLQHAGHVRWIFPRSVFFDLYIAAGALKARFESRGRPWKLKWAHDIVL